MSPHHLERVRASWTRVSRDADAAWLIFHSRLFALAPELRALFADDLAAQGRHMIRAISLAVSALGEAPMVQHALWDLGRRHRALGVRPEHFPLVGEALLLTLAQLLEQDFDNDCRLAWAAAYAQVTRPMLAGLSSPGSTPVSPSSGVTS